MEPVKKYATFEELKSSEKKPGDYTVSLKRHNGFKKFILALHSSKVYKNASK